MFWGMCRQLNIVLLTSALFVYIDREVMQLCERLIQVSN